MKIKKGIIIAVIIVLVIIVGVVLGIFLKKDDVKVNSDEENIITSGDIVESGEKEERKIDKTKDWVYSIFEGENGNEGPVRIPYINLNSSKAKKINIILENCAAKIKDELAKEGVHFTYNGNDSAIAMDYEFYLNDNILSFVLRVDYESDAICNINVLENFDINTGKTLTSEEILRYKKIDEKELLNKLPEIYDNEFKIVYAYRGKVQGDESLDKAYNDTIKDIPQNINDISVYLDSDSKIHMIIEIEQIAGMAGKMGIEVELPYLNEYVSKYSDRYFLSKRDLVNLNKKELEIAYNEIFARHGHDFKTKWLKEYFNSLSWYAPIKDKQVSLEELSNAERANAELIKSEIANGKELDLNKTTIDDLLALNNIKLEKLDKRNLKFNLGEIKLGDVGYSLMLYYNYDEKPFESFEQGDVVITIEKDDYCEVLIDNYGSIDGVTSIANNKYFIISGFLDDGLIEKIIVIDKNGIAFVANGFNLEHNVENGKIFYSAHDKYAGYVEGAIGDYNYYKVYYEIVEENGKLTSKELRVDYNDIEMTAQT